MADNTTQAGADTIRTKDRSGIKTEIFGLDVGIGTGTEALLSSTNPLPITSPNGSLASTSLTAVDAVVAAPIGDGTLVSGTSTAGSFAAVAVPDGMSSWTMLLKGLVASQTTQTVYFEASFNSTNGNDGDWVEVKGRRTGVAAGIEAVDYKATSNGYYRGNDSGFSYLRARLVGAYTAGVTVQMKLSNGTGAVFLNSGLPAGTSTLGTVWTNATDVVGTGTISATDAVLGVHAGAGVLLSGTPTANSYVALALSGGESTYIVQVTGTFGSGTVWFETSANSTTGIDGSWSTLSLRAMGTSGATATTISDSTTTAGLFRGNASGMTYIRTRITGATTPSVAVVLRGSDAAGPVALNAALPAGTNNIGVVGPAPSATGTITAPALSLTSFTLLAANTARKTATFYNDSNNLVYLAMAATASTTSYSVQLPSGGYYELPGTNAVFTGLVSGIALTATGNVRVTELT